MALVEAGFVGRGAELGLLDAAFAEVAAGRPTVVLVHGPAGIGKTALVRRFLASHPQRQVIWAVGDEAESLLGFGVIDQLGRAAAAGSPSAARSRGPDHLAVGAELLEWLAGRSARGPLAVVVDDAPWADGPSLQALGFALRRLVSEPVLAVFIARDEDLGTLPPGVGRFLSGERVVSLPVAGLGEADVRSLAEAAGHPGFPLGAARRLRTHTAGNPLHARALLTELDPGVWSATGSGPLPAPASFAALVLGRLAHCSPPTRALVAAAAVLGMHCSLADAAALAASDDPAAALDEAATADLLEAPLRGGELRFPHPLVQAAVYHDLAPGRRAALHAAAAGRARSTAEALRHRAAACLHEDPVLAAELAGFAAEQAGRGSWAAAADAYLNAARVAPGPEAEVWLLSGVECLVLAGDTPAALGMRGRVEGCRDCAQRHYVLGLISSVRGDPEAGVRSFARAWAAAGPRDGETAAKTATHLARVAANEGRAPDALTWVRRALDGQVPPSNLGMAKLIEAFGFGEMGRFADGLAAMGEPPDPDSLDGGALGALGGRGVLYLWSRELGAAVADFSLADEVARRQGPMTMRIVILIYWAHAEYRLGRWDEATVHAELAVSLANDAGEAWTLALAHAVAALPAAGRGDWARAEAHLAAGGAIARWHGGPANHFWVATARARLAQARSDWAGLLVATDDVLALDIPYGKDVPGIQPWALLRAEALTATHRLAEAAVLLDGIEERVGDQDQTTTRVSATRVRALLAAAGGRPEEAGAAFEKALGLAAGHEVTALELALLHLDYGAALRRAGRRRAAAEQLVMARGLLAALGAAPFLERTERELAACGLARGGPRRDVRSLLSPQEQAVATLVATGLTNRQVAERLVLSTKGVEYHLGHVFAKLGVATRAELAARLAPPERPTPPPH